MNAVDTNVLLYVRDPRDSAKQRLAADLIRSEKDGLLLWQVACELQAASRKLAAFGYGPEDARQDIAALREVWSASLPSWNTLQRADQLRVRYTLSFWDALLAAAALEAGAKRLYSEDFGGLADIDGMQVVNPFAEVHK